MRGLHGVLQKSGALTVAMVVSKLLLLYEAPTLQYALAILADWGVTHMAYTNLQADIPSKFGNMPLKEVLPAPGFMEVLRRAFTMIYENFSDAFLPAGFSRVINVSGFVDEVMFQTRRLQAVSVATFVSQQLAEFCTRLKLCLTERSLKPLFDTAESYSAWRLEATAICSYAPELIQTDAPVLELKRFAQLRENGHIPSYWNEPFSVVEFYGKVDHLHKMGLEHMQRISVPTILADARTIVGRLKSFQEQYSGMCAGSAQRVTPYSIFICGKPGCGKSNFSQDVFHSIGRVQGYNTDNQSQYYWQTNVNFQTGMGNQWFINFDDTDQNTGPPVLGMDNHCTTIIKVVNNAPLPIEEADVSLKGKTFARPMFCCTTSNYTEFRDKDYIADNKAYRRRFNLHIVPIPTIPYTVRIPLPKGDGVSEEQYAQYLRDFNDLTIREGETELQRDERCGIPQPLDRLLDFSRVPKGCCEHLILRVSKWNRQAAEHIFVADMAMPDFFRYLNVSYRAHMDHQHAVLTRTSTVSWCEHCGLSTDNGPCTCVLHTYQGPYIPHTTYVETPSGTMTAVAAISSFLFLWQVTRAVYVFEDVVEDTKEVTEPMARKANETMNALTDMAYDVSNFLSRLPRFAPIAFPVVPEFLLPVVSKKSLALCAFAATMIGLAYKFFRTIGVQSDLTPVDPPPMKDVLPKSNSWDRRVQREIPISFEYRATWSKDQLIACMRKNMLIFTNDKGIRMRGLVVSTNLVAVNKHGLEAFVECPTGSYKYLDSDVEYGIAITPAMCDTRPGSDLGFIFIGSLVAHGAIKLQTINEVVQDGAFFDEACIVYPDEVKEFTPVVEFFPREGLGIRSKSPVLTEKGDCGFPYIAARRGQWFLVGIHFSTVGMAMVSGLCGGLVLSQRIVADRCKRLATMYADAVLPPAVLKQGYVSGNPVTVEPYDRLSEVWAAVSHHNARVVPCGRATAPLNSHGNRSEVVPTLCSTLFFNKYALKWTGSNDPIFERPLFNGKMVNDVWISPWVNSIIPLKTIVAPRELLMLALMDYVSGLRFIPDFPSVRSLTDDEVVCGIDGTCIDSLNLDSSAGMPFNKKKKLLITVDRVEEKVVVNEELMSHVQLFEELLADGIAPSPVTLGMLKDEPIAPSKNETRNVRVFNNVPASFNWVAKKHLTPLEAIMRLYPEIFESYVGINIASKEGDAMIRRLLNHSPLRGLDVDMKKQDKSITGEMIHLVALFVYALAKKTKIDPMNAMLIIEGARNALHVAKGRDLYKLGGSNISGVQFTLLQAGVDNSLGQRYIYYRMKYPDGIPEHLAAGIRSWQNSFLDDPSVPEALLDYLTFREDVKLATFGDDAASSVAESCEFYTPSLIPTLGAELGKVYTDGQKSDDFGFRPVTSLVFLKRNFVYNEELGMYLTPLSKKSILKTLTMRMSSTLSCRDQEAIMMMDCLREMALHGREDYEDLVASIREFAPQYGIDDSQFFNIHSYDYYWDIIKNDKFVCWAPQKREERAEFGGKLDLQTFPQSDQPTMSAESTQDVGENSLYDQTAGQAHADAGISVLVDNELALIGGEASKPVDFPLMPKNDFSNFLERRTRLGIRTASSTDVYQGTVGSTLDPHATFIADPFIADKIDAFRYLRGDFRITATVTSAPGCYGLYALVAFPRSFSYSAGAKTWTMIPSAYKQYPHVEMDVARSINVELVLPWIHPYNAGEITGAGRIYPVDSMWEVRVICLSAVKSALAAAAIPNVNIILFGQFEPGYQLSVAYLQGFKDKVKEKSVQVLGDTPSAVAKKVSATAAQLSAIPVIGSLAAPVATGAAAISSALSMFGFTRETAETKPTPVVPRPWANVANIDVPDTSEIAALSVANTVSIDHSLMGLPSTDHTAVAFLEQHWQIIGKINWGQATGATGQLKTIPVTPFIGENGMDVGGGWVPTVGGYIAMPFSSWRSDMEYKIVIPCANFHRGILQVSYQPDLTAAAGDPTNSRYNFIIDIEQGNDFEFCIPYMQARPWLQTTPKIFSPVVYSGANANGFFRIDVVTPLRAPLDTAAVDIIVYARSKNIQFAGPRQQFPNIDNTGAVTYNDIMYNVNLQGFDGALGSSAPPTTKVVDFIPARTDIDPRPLYMGEQPESVRALMQKLSLIPLKYSPGDPSTGFGNKRIIVNHFFNPPYTGNLFHAFLNMFADDQNYSQFTWFGYYSILFHGIAGSTRYKLMNTNLPTAGSVGQGAKYFGVAPVPADVDTFQTSATGSNYGSGNLAGTRSISQIDPGWLVRIGEAVEITVPYYGVLDYCSTHLAPSVGAYNGFQAYSRADQIEICDVSQSNATSASFALYIGGGPDLRFHMFKGIRAFKTPTGFFNPGMRYGTINANPTPAIAVLPALVVNSTEEEEDVQVPVGPEIIRPLRPALSAEKILLEHLSNNGAAGVILE
jgi:hypothetical protein